MSPEELIKKTLTTSDFFAGGALPPEKQKQFVSKVRGASVLLKEVRSVDMTTPQQDIDSLHLGEPILHKAPENTDPAITSRPKFSKITLSVAKGQAVIPVSTESLEANIEQAALEETIVNRMTERLAVDVEALAIRGDNSIVATDAWSELLKILDGWIIQSEECLVLDAGGAAISKGLLAEALRMLPSNIRSDAGLRYIASDTIVNDWMDLVSDRLTGAGDNSLAGKPVAPYGRPWLPVPMIPDDMPLYVTTPTHW